MPASLCVCFTCMKLAGKLPLPKLTLASLRESCLERARVCGRVCVCVFLYLSVCLCVFFSLSLSL